MLTEFYLNGKGPDMDERKGYLNLKDMFDGGGPGQSGDKFMGGGLLSMLGNALGIAPYGANRERDLEMAANVAAGVALKPEVAAPVMRAEEMAYSGRGDYGMPQQPMQYGGRGDYGMPQQPMQYSGRGSAGMPYPEFAQDEMSRRNIDYLRSIGMIDY